MYEPDGGSIASASLGFFQAMAKNGKPQPKEWTVFAAFLVSSDHDRTLRAVVTAGSGTKCLPGSKRSAKGDLVSDCHAEVIARRSLLIWLYGEAELAVQEASSPSASCSGTQGQLQHQKKASSCMRWDRLTGRLKLRPGLRFHLYVSQPPCGDGSIVSLPEGSAAASGRQEAEDGSSGDWRRAGTCCGAEGNWPEGERGRAVGEKSKAVVEPSEVEQLDAATEADVACMEGEEQPTSSSVLRLRTGAKAIRLTEAGKAAREEEREGALATVAASAAVRVPLAGDVEDGPQQLGLARRKPGKGEPTLSMSCSDKIAKWTCLGLQGCLLGALMAVEGILLASVTVGAPPSVRSVAGDGALQAVQSALERALVTRLEPLRSRLAPSCGGSTGSEAGGGGGSKGTRLRVHAVAPSDEAELGLAPSEQRKVGSGASISWVAPAGCCGAPAASHSSSLNSTRPSLGSLEVVAAGDGCRAGMSKVARADPKNMPRSCRLALLRRFCSLVELMEQRVVERVEGPVAAGGEAEGGGEAERAGALLPASEGGAGKAAGEGVATSRASTAPSSQIFRRAAEHLQAAGSSSTDAVPASNLSAGPVAPSPLRLLSYREVKRICGEVGGYREAWQRLCEHPSPFECWIPKPDHLLGFNAVGGTPDQ